MKILNLYAGIGDKRKYKVGDIVKDKWGRIGKIVKLRGCSCCGQLYEITGINGYLVEGNIQERLGHDNLQNGSEEK